jgi:starch synthase
MQHIQVLAVASEVYPLVKTGGLADVIGALPAALEQQDIETRTIVPGYPAVLAALTGVEEVRRWERFYGGPARILAATVAGLDLFVVDAPHLFDRPGNPYVGPNGRDWPDNAIRFAALARAAADIGRGDVPAFVPHVVHAHDWQAGLTHAFLQHGGCPRPGTVTTIHNIAFQGRFPRAMLSEIGLPPESFRVDGVEYFGDIGYLKAALQFADRITTVSPTYALEIQSAEAGMGLEGLLRARADVLSGIINGIDLAVWNPADDSRIAANYTAEKLAARAANKRALQARFDLSVTPDAFLLGVISRLAWQKGLDLVLGNIPMIARDNMQLVLLGSGEQDLQERFVAASLADPDRIGTAIGYDEDLAHLIQAGADALLVPSRFEPCGLTQLCALRYGAVPIVSRVGGLADTLVDANEMAISAGVATGFQFAPVTGDALARTILRARAVFKDKPAWQKMQTNGMATDVSWRHPAARYAALYREVADIRR